MPPARFRDVPRGAVLVVHGVACLRGAAGSE